MKIRKHSVICEILFLLILPEMFLLIHFKRANCAGQALAMPENENETGSK